MQLGISPFSSGSAGPSDSSPRVVMGQWPQGEAAGPEPIIWLVRHQDGGSMLLLAEKALDAAPFHIDESAAGWEDCTLRAWLNGEFLSRAFSEEERSRIIPTATGTDYENQVFSSSVDSVFLLSQREAETYLGEGTPSWCPPTPYAQARGAFHTGILGTTFWWLRGLEREAFAPCVSQIGLYTLRKHDCTDAAVRPALWVHSPASCPGPLPDKK